MTPGHGNGKVLVDDPLLDEDSEDVRSGENNLSSTKHDEARLARGTKKRCLIMVTAISSLCYARSQYANRFQVQAGYYMIAAGVGKRPIEVLNHFGVSVSHKSLVNVMKTLANSAEHELKTLLSRFPSSFFCLDNMDFFSRVKNESLHNQSELRHWTVAYAAINPLSHANCMM